MRIKKGSSNNNIEQVQFNSHTEPVFRTFQILKIDDQLKLQELKYFKKYWHGNLPGYFK